MKQYLAVDPDDYTLEFLAGSDNFFKVLTHSYYKTKMSDLEDVSVSELDDIVTRLLMGDLPKESSCKFGDVLNNAGQKFCISESLFNLLEQLSAEEQQTILANIYRAFK